MRYVRYATADFFEFGSAFSFASKLKLHAKYAFWPCICEQEPDVNIYNIITIINIIK